MGNRSKLMKKSSQKIWNSQKKTISLHRQSDYNIEI